MRILVVGAGAVGGYFGARLLAAGRDVTFLVRPHRATELAKTGLVVKSKLGDVSLAAPPTISADAIKSPFNVVLVSCKAYDLSAAIESFAPAVGPSTSIVPLLNGMAHLDALMVHFGEATVLGGQCAVSLTLDSEGRILHLNDTCVLTYGEPKGDHTKRLDSIAVAFAGIAEGGPSERILQEMWEKWVFIATAAGITCLMRAAVGDIVAAGAGDRTLALLDEISSIAANQGFAPRPPAAQRARTMLTAAGSPFKASMLRDIESDRLIEADHILGDLLKRDARTASSCPMLRLAYAHLKAYEAQRARLREGSAR
ncbi:MAG: 2-dehydropantoate 2-reductase [Bradyrhizobium sp.]|jgi:2-dehydropantoate 2-reductase|nr:2-dehydropantoate 2-reductase [Bradyrhizobium sp.]